MMVTTRKLLSAALVLCAGVLAACDGDNDPIEPAVTAPANVAVTPISATGLRVSFDAVAGATSYTIQRAPASGGDFTTVNTGPQTSFDDTGLQAQTTYRYRVAATAGSRTSDYSSERVGTTGATPVVTISSNITGSRTFYADTIYKLDAFVKVTNGATLTIQPGTVVQGEQLSALFVLPGAKIMAVGTAQRPIVFTSARAVGDRKPGDWGGLVLVGRGIINRTGQIALEGTGTNTTTNPTVFYGNGGDNADNSGTLRYVRIEFAGFGPAQDAELNALTMAAVGSGTTLEYVQTVAGLDDSFEWFGGAVDGKYLVSYESGDDHFDASEGYVGRNQFVIAFQSARLEPRTGAGAYSNDPQGIENDGCADAQGGTCPAGQNSTPFTTPMFANFTLVGTGPGVVGSGGGYGMMLRRGTGGYYVNGIVTRWPNAAIALRDASTMARVGDGSLVVRSLLLAENAKTFENATNTVDPAVNAIQTVEASTASLFTAFPTGAPSGAAAFDWTPSAGSAARTGGTGAFTGALATRAGSFVTGTSYRGAVDPAGAKWWQGWTTYA
ncbi:MAG TPA: fibronectin type III domain-containing protein, partial [Longimicrobiaceae bacterium]|nr:fibronectin type III domain-containing protein [Longimicrobiaceae bacterium]